MPNTAAPAANLHQIDAYTYEEEEYRRKNIPPVGYAGLAIIGLAHIPVVRTGVECQQYISFFNYKVI